MDIKIDPAELITTIERLTVKVAELYRIIDEVKRDLREHVRGHLSGWLWIVPTVLILIQLILQAAQTWGK